MWCPNHVTPGFRTSPIHFVQVACQAKTHSYMLSEPGTKLVQLESAAPAVPSERHRKSNPVGGIISGPPVPAPLQRI